MDTRKHTMKHTATLAVTCLLIYVMPAGKAEAAAATNGHTATAGHIMEEALKSRDFEGASVSMLAINGAGDTLLCHDSGRLLIPASNMKLVTTALALHSLGGDYRYETRIGYCGTISDGILEGDLYIIGGGDPTLGSRNRIAIPTDTLFAQWERLLRQAGISGIHGCIIGDGRFFSGMDEHPTWELCDAGTYYGTGASGLNFYENVQDFKVSAGAAPGDPVCIKSDYPESPWMEIMNSAVTGKAGTGNTLYFYPGGFAPVGEMRGTFAVDRKPKTESAANKFPEYTLAWYFTKYLSECGMECTGGPADLGPVFRPDRNSPVRSGMNETDGTGRHAGLQGYGDWAPAVQDSLKILGGTLSPTLAEIARVTNTDSNNLYAETLFKTLGKEYCGNGCYDSAAVAVRGLLEEIGAGDRRLRIRDGSGLSREDLLDAGFICTLLERMMVSPAFEDFFGSLPYPGGEGTLEYYMTTVPAETRQRIRMKSGSMGGVRCFSGYITPVTGAKEDAVIFSLMVNGFTAPLHRVQNHLFRIIEALAVNP